MHFLTKLLTTLVLATMLLSCKHAPVLKAGNWRGVIELQGRELPFNFEVEQDSASFKIIIKNGDERLTLDEVSIVGDSVTMVLHIFDAKLVAYLGDNQLSGYFIRNYAADYRFPFHATHGDEYRFVKPTTSTTNFSGKYDVRFCTEADTTISVGVFEQKDNHVTGTFLRNDGDFRYLEGNEVDGELKMSAFDGNHAFLFTARKNGDTLRGHFYAGKNAHEVWIAIRNDAAALPNAESLTSLKSGYDKIDFSFPDVDGKKISSSDDRYKNKVVILQLLGTWCPNCMDETKFLAPWYNKNKDRGVEIIGLAYERKGDFDYASARVKKMIGKLDVRYDIAIAGVNDKAKAAATLPALNKVLAFPTTIFIGRDGKVKHIHTGFSGPGTGIYYEQFVQRFDAIVSEMLNDKTILKK